MTTPMIESGEARIEALEAGGGPALVMIPSLGRGAEDFADLSTRLVAAGYRVIRPQPRGIGASVGPMADLTLHDLAADVAAVLDARSQGPVVAVGHAFGNRVARVLASDFPTKVVGVVLIAAGGVVPPAPDVAASLRAVFDTRLSAEAHLQAVKKAFFAEGNDPAVWRDGWFPDAALSQERANASTPIEEWWDAGRKPVLVIQGRDDVVAVPENGHRLRASAPERIDVIDLPNAGHALLPEQPVPIAAHLLRWLAQAGNAPN